MDRKTEESPCVWVSAVKILFFVMLLLSVAGLIYFSSIDHSSPLEQKDPVFITEWTMTNPDGRVSKTGSSYRNESGEKGSFVMTSKLPDSIKNDSYLCFIVGGDVSVYVNGELRKDFIAERDVVVPGGCVKRFYMRVPLSSADSGADVKMIRTIASRGGYVYQNTFVADDVAFFNFMISSYGTSFMLCVIILIFSAVVVVVSLFMMLLYRRRIEMLYGGLSILVIAAWLITNSYLYPFMFGHYHVDGVMNYMLCLMMPFGLAFYVEALQHGRYKRTMMIVMCANSINLVLWPILHLTRTFPFPNALIYIDMIQGVELFIVAGMLVTDLARGYIKEYKYTAIGFSGFFVCGLGEIVVLNFLPVINGDILMLTGLAFMLTLTVIQQMADLRKVREEGQRAVDLSEAKTRFLASMSHEIRTPINAILGMNEMILRENTDPVIGEYADSVKSSGQMLLMLVNDVLDFSKIEAGKMEINNARFYFSSILRSIMPMLEERAGEKNLKLQTVILNEVPDGMVSDEFRIRQILVNIINNAIKYTDTGSVTLMIGGGYSGDDSYKLRMSVKDTGRGIGEEDQKHLFEAFARADMRKNRNIEGTGLGLAIVKSILDSMSGSISVVSRYGEGSEFIVDLPVKVYDRTILTAEYDRHTDQKVQDRGEADYIAPDASVLAVDDNSSNLKIVKLFLKRVGITPELCGRGSEAIELCRSKHYDVILLDHMMPDPDGIKTLGIIKSDEASLNKDTPVVVLTANALAGSDKVYSDAGFADYLTKPIDSSILEKTVKKHLPAGKIMIPRKAVFVEKAYPPDEKAHSDTAQAGEQAPASLAEKLKRMDGVDYETALSHAGHDEGLLEEMAGIVLRDNDKRIDKMRGYITAGDFGSYGLEAHTVKSLMASIGLMELSERARKHEFAAGDNDSEFILSDSEAFFKELKDVCDRLR